MQKKVYINHLTDEEIIHRLHTGEKIYTDMAPDGDYYAYKDGHINYYNADGTVYYINAELTVTSSRYFLDEVEEDFTDCVGKLGWFWDNGDRHLGVLNSVCKTPTIFKYYSKGCGVWKHYQPLTLEEVKQYIKE